MLINLLKKNRVILGSASPRRSTLLEEMGVSFQIRKTTVDEKYPEKLTGAAIPEYLAKLKADALRPQLMPQEILITADTVVWHKGAALEKPMNYAAASNMLHKLSDDWHEVITAVGLTTTTEFKMSSQTTRVKFKALTAEEIEYYITQYHPFDKAGAYGIQEWIGLIAIEEIQGSYTNVVGLPTHLLYDMLITLAG